MERVLHTLMIVDLMEWHPGCPRHFAVLYLNTPGCDVTCKRHKESTEAFIVCIL